MHRGTLTIHAAGVTGLFLTAGAACGQEILWDNGLFETCGTAWSSERDTTVEEATMFDDFLVSEWPVVVTGLRALYVVAPPDGGNEPPPGGFTGLDAIFVPVDQETGGPDCNSPIVEVFDLPPIFADAGGTDFGLQRWIASIDDLSLTLEPGRYFQATRPVDSGAGRAFVRMSFCDDEVQFSESYLQSEFFGFPECTRGTELLGFPTDLAFQVVGFVFGEPGRGFFRDVTPIVFTGEPEGGVAEVWESDDERYIIQAGPGFNAVAPHGALVEFTTTLPSLPLERMDLRVESHANKPLVMQEIKLYDFDAGQFQTIHEGMLSLNEDQTVTILDLVDPDRFINDADGRIRLWLRTASPALSANPHQLLVDEVKLVLTYETP